MRTPCPVWGPLAGEDAEERSSATGRQSAGCIGSPPAPAGPTHRSRSCCCLPAAPWGSGHTHRLTGCRRPGFPAPEQVAENCPSVAGVRGAAGVGTRGGENDAPQRGRVPGRSHPASWATPPAGGSVLELRAEGCMPSWGVKAAWHTARDHHRTPQRARGRAPGRRPAARCQTTPSSVPMTQSMNCSVAAEGAIFWPRWKWECGGGNGGSAASCSPLGPGVSGILGFFSLSACLPASLPYSFIQPTSDQHGDTNR